MRVTRWQFVLFIGFFSGASSPAADPSQVGRHQPAPNPDAAAIARLVRQLGSDDPAEREAAARALEKAGPPALEALRSATKSADAETRRRAASLVDTIENGLDNLLVEYRRYELPLPPLKAPLVRFPMSYQGQRPASFALGFRLSEDPDTHALRYLCGVEVQTDYGPKKGEVIEPGNLSVKEADGLVRSTDLGNYGGLIFALQCKGRCWDRLAEAALRESEHLTQMEYGDPFEIEISRARPRHRLAIAGWERRVATLADPNTERSALGRRLRAMLAGEPRLDAPQRLAFLRSLDATAVPSTAAPGSVHALIDELIEMRTSPFWCAHAALTRLPNLGPGQRERPEIPADNSYARLIARGFEAVPELIEHLDDSRPTRFRHDRERSVGYRRYEDSQGYETVGQTAARILYWYTGEEFGADKVRARAWGRSARRGDEAAQLLARVLEGPSTGSESDEPDPVNEVALLVLARKHPQLLSDVYRTLLLTRPELDGTAVVGAILDAPITLERKIEALLPAAAGEYPRHSEVAIRALRELDPHRSKILRFRQRRNNLSP